ncbi:hypothetical protein GGR57DRAFT_92145 [Xylariaceae sp. FL1272]|nr:hypothetical protein GGR57DRAFT_92145 [Xylariaceae sp. FL1272]
MMANIRALTGLLAITGCVTQALGAPGPKKLTFKTLKNIIAFGDSYTDVGYNHTIAPQPSPSNYEGNPVPPGTSTCYSPNYVQMLSSQYNETFVRLYDLAHSGAVVDGDLVDPYESVDNTFVHQVSDKFLPYFSGGMVPKGNGTRGVKGYERREWKGEDTLIVAMFGVNDVDRAMGGYWPLDPEWEEKAPKMLDSLFDGLEAVRQQGAESFAILSMPPYWLSPSVQEYENATYTQLAQNRTLLWIDELHSHFDAWTAEHTGLSAQIVDTFQLWLNMTYETENYPPLSQVITDCDAYVGGNWPVGDLEYNNSTCAAPMKEYLWLDWVHPTWTVHKYMARLIIDTMGL